MIAGTLLIVFLVKITIERVAKANNIESRYSILSVPLSEQK